MCGVPYHAAETYIYRLIQKGYKVAICEQMEDPKKAKGLVKRDVIRVITPGTILFENAIADQSNNYLVYIYEAEKKINAVVAMYLPENAGGEFGIRKKRQMPFSTCFQFMLLQKRSVASVTICIIR